MREGNDLDSFLQNGYWANSKAKTPDPRFSSSSYNDPTVPRYSHSTTCPPELRRRSPRPPAPTVEDEADSVAKESGSLVSAHPEEEAQHPGPSDQEHIIEVLHEYNPERRFVFVPNSTAGSDEAREELKQAARAKRSEDNNGKPSPFQEQEPERDTYEANTCRKYVILPDEDGHKDRDITKPTPEDRERRPIMERRKSKLENLPAIVTDIRSDDRNDTQRPDIRRSRSASGAAEPGADNYFSPRRSSQRLRDDSMLTPDVIKHATKGRDRAYYDYSSASTANQTRSRTNQAQEPRENRYPRRHDEDIGRPYSAAPVDVRKAPEAPRNVRRTSKEGSIGYDRDHSGYDKTRQYSDRPSKTSRTNSSSSTKRPDRESLRPRSSSFRGKRESPPYEDPQYPSAGETERRTPSSRRDKSYEYEERKAHLDTPVETKLVRRKSRPTTPLASPRITQGDLLSSVFEPNLSRSPRSATFPTKPDSRRNEARNSIEEDYSLRPPSRASIARTLLNSNAPIAIPVMTAAAVAAVKDSGSPIDRRSSAVPVPHKARVVATTQSDSNSNSRSSSSTPSASSPPKRTWQPPKFDPYRDGAHTDKPATSYRRYSEGYKGELPTLPDCPRTKETAGHMDWLTLPKCNNFNICPSCYDAAFGNTEWRNAFVPAPFRPRERPLKCDFGSSMWYHIAWLLTHTHRKPDLRMFQGLNNVTASYQPCSAKLSAVRIWYTIRDPVTQRPVRGFKLCHHCAKSIETLLPNLSGVFVPMDSPAEARHGVCCMHQESYTGGERKRFLEYWDAIETTSDLALAAQTAPNIRSLADKVREISLVEECYGSQPLASRKWHTMRSVPAFTVCEECFNEVIWPEIERDSSGIQAEFYKNPQKLEVAACQLYSDRMRKYFRAAVANDDIEYFRSRIMRRRQKEQEFYEKVRDLDPNILGREWVDAEIDRAKREWRRHE